MLIWPLCGFFRVIVTSEFFNLLPRYKCFLNPFEAAFHLFNRWYLSHFLCFNDGFSSLIQTAPLTPLKPCGRDCLHEFPSPWELCGPLSINLRSWFFCVVPCGCLWSCMKAPCCTGLNLCVDFWCCTFITALDTCRRCIGHHLSDDTAGHRAC